MLLFFHHKKGREQDVSKGLSQGGLANRENPSPTLIVGNFLPQEPIER